MRTSRIAINAHIRQGHQKLPLHRGLRVIRVVGKDVAMPDIVEQGLKAALQHSGLAHSETRDRGPDVRIVRTVTKVRTLKGDR